MRSPIIALTTMLLAACAAPKAEDITAPVAQQADQSLVGYWEQTDAECADAEPIYELKFMADGRYTVTWLPFESYKDYWGRWRYDPATGELNLTVEGGNYVPTDVTPSGRVRAEGATLTLETLSLGSPSHNRGRCSAPFHRR